MYRNVVQSMRSKEFDLRDHMLWPRLPITPQLGHAGVHTPKLNLADYIEKGAEPPAGVHRPHLDFKWGMLLNDRLSDCGEAMAIHGIDAFHLDAGTPVPPFVDGDAERLYEKVGGYVPGDPSTDGGTDNDVLVNYWQTQGVSCAADGSTHKIVGSLFVDPHDQLVSRFAIWEFVALFRAAALPLTAQGQHIWQVVGDGQSGASAPGSWGNHDYLYVSYDSHRLRNVTWGTELLVNWSWDLNYALQGFVVLTREMLNRRGTSPSGVNWTALTRDFQKL